MADQAFVEKTPDPEPTPPLRFWPFAFYTITTAHGETFDAVFFPDPDIFIPMERRKYNNTWVRDVIQHRPLDDSIELPARKLARIQTAEMAKKQDKANSEKAEGGRASIYKLKDCPYCNLGKLSTIRVFQEDLLPTIRYVHCWRCGMRGPSQEGEYEAVEAWNRLPRKQTSME